ncbi:FHA domain-containing protein [Adlercreutzia sp. ZJ176]
MNCPLCGGRHPEGTTFCNVVWAEISQITPATTRSAQDDTEVEKSISGTAICPCCGAIGNTNEECWQCGTPVGASGNSFVAIHFPSARSIQIAYGETVTIGRESSNKDVAAAARHYDTISRKHCVITVDESGNYISVIDCGSTNGTRIPELDHPITAGTKHQLSLPTRIQLGTSIELTIDKEP